MLTSSRNGSICVRCAFRMRLRLLEQQRHRSSTAAAEAGDHDPDFSIAYHRGKSKSTEPSIVRYQGSDSADDLRRGHKRLTNGRQLGPASKLAGGAIVRKLFKEDGKDHDRSGRASAGKAFNDQRAGRFREQAFRDVLHQRLNKVKEEVKDAPLLAQVAKEQKEWDGQGATHFTKLWKQFTQKALKNGTVPEISELFSGPGTTPTQDSSLWNDLFEAWRARGDSGLEDRIKFAFYGHVTNSRFTESDIRNQKSMADLRYPTEWFPATRSLHRTVHLHVGPTNSGKTYQALKRLEEADTGVYAGPLRLLAHEVYSRLNAKGKNCALVTGEERRAPTTATETGELQFGLTACTVEMTPLNATLDVAVIDEIQMIGNSDRGWAWTQALLGVRAKEVHLCGEKRTVPLIKELCASIGDKLVIHEYERLSPLEVAQQSLDGDLRRLRKGDCVISFSVMGIHALRKQIEKSTGRKVATVYGSLPPETRAQQARLFNDPNNDYDFLVASDAVGMGLNLAIKRIVFESSTKFNGYQRQTLNIADIKQIGGRAGRFRTAAQAADAPASEQDLAAAKGESQTDENAMPNDDGNENVGLVTTLERFDFPIVRAAMAAEPEPIKSAGLFPPAPVLERFAGYFPPGTPFSYILTRLHELSQMHSRFHLCGLKDQVWIADLVEGIEGLTVADRNILCSSPANKSDSDMWKDLMPAYGRAIANQKGGDLTEIAELPLEILEAEISGTREYLRSLERLHKGVVVYLWLSYRFAGIFNTRNLAFHVKQLVEDEIEKTLSSFSFTEAMRRKLAQRREQDLMAAMMPDFENGEEPPSAVSEQTSETSDVEADTSGAVEENVEQSSEHTAEQAQQYEGLELGAELEGSEAQSSKPYLQGQTSQIGGGDHFSGEELEIDEPGLEPEGQEEASTPTEEAQAETNVEENQAKKSSAEGM